MNVDENEFDNDISTCNECCKPIKELNPEPNKPVICPNCGHKHIIRPCWMLQSVYTEEQLSESKKLVERWLNEGRK